MLRTDLPPITTQIISCVILNTADHNTTDFPGHDAVLNCSLLPIKHSTHFFFFSQNNAHTRNCAVWMDTQVTCCVRSSTGNLNFMDPKPINSKYVTFLNSGNVEVLLEMLIEVHKSNNYFQTAFKIIKTLWLLYLSHLLITMASTVNIIHLSLMRKLNYISSDSLGGTWKLGTASTTSHQEEQVLSIAWVVLEMGSSGTCPAASGSSERGLPSQCYIRACAHLYPSTGEFSWGCSVLKKKQLARTADTWVTLQYICTTIFFPSQELCFILVQRPDKEQLLSITQCVAPSAFYWANRNPIGQTVTVQLWCWVTWGTGREVNLFPCQHNVPAEFDYRKSSFAQHHWLTGRCWLHSAGLIQVHSSCKTLTQATKPSKVPRCWNAIL